MSKANTNLPEGRICAFCQNWQGNANPIPDHSNPDVYEYDRSAKGRCACKGTITSAYFHCGDFMKSYNIR